MRIFLFGSTGDLARRKILPAISKLNLKDLKLFAVGRKDYLNELYVKNACTKTCTIQKNINYFKANFENEFICEDCITNLSKTEINYFYISLPPDLFELLIKKINLLKLSGYNVKILLEKPFGSSLTCAKKIEKLLKKFKLEEDVFLADHYLFKSTILKIKKQELIEKDFEKLKIVSLEELGLEGRISYYDKNGALIDMVQSHLFNIMFKFLTKKEIKNLKIIQVEKKQYKGYEKELGKISNTETFVKIKLKTNNKEIELITGKKFNKKINKMFLDDKEIDIIDDGAYEKMISSFLENNKENFPQIKDTLASWEIVEKINKKKVKLIKYKINTKFNV